MGADELAEARAATAAVHVPGPKRMIGRRVTRNCLGCGRPWPCKHSWQARAEAAEAREAEVRQTIATFLRVRGAGRGAGDLAEAVRQVLDRGEIGSEEVCPGGC